MGKEDTRYSRWSSVQVGEFPADLSAVLVLVGLTVLVVFLPATSESPLRLVVGLPFLLFAPGYALLAALFPERGRPAAAAQSASVRARTESAADRSIDGVVRLGLSLGTSVAAVSVVGIVLDATGLGLGLVPAVGSLSGFVLVCTAVAAYRRWDLPPEARYRLPYRRWYATARRELLYPDSSVDIALNVLVVCSLLAALAGVGYAVSVPVGDEQFTEFSLLTEDTAEGLVAAGYPTTLGAGESAPVVLGIENHERETVDYSVVVQLQRVRLDGTGTETTVSVTERRELGRFGVTVEPGANRSVTYRVEPTTTGDRLRLAFLLYRGDSPADPRLSNAYRETHLWLNVTAPDGAAQPASIHVSPSVYTLSA